MANSASIPRDNLVKELNAGGVKKLVYPLSTGGSFDFQQGDLLWYDTSVPCVKPLDSDAHANATFAGVALNGSYIGPYASAQQSGGYAGIKNYNPSALVGFGAIFTFYSTGGDTYSHGDAVKWGSGSNTISKTGSNAVGYVFLPNGSSTGIAGGATVLVPILIVANYPVSSGF